jgi:hypothetical protein
MYATSVNGLLDEQALDKATGGLQSLSDWLRSIFDPKAITYTGRELNVADMGTTEGGVISVKGWIGRDDTYLNMVIYDIRATGFTPGTGIILQGLEAAYTTTRDLGLEGFTIQGSLANERLSIYLTSVAQLNGGVVYSNGSWETVVVPVSVEVPVPLPSIHGRP